MVGRARRVETGSAERSGGTALFRLLRINAHAGRSFPPPFTVGPTLRATRLPCSSSWRKPPLATTRRWTGAGLLRAPPMRRLRPLDSRHPAQVLPCPA